MDPEISKRLDALEAKIDATYKAAEKTRKYLFWTFVVGLVVTVLPLIGLIFTAPFLFSTLSSAYGGIQ